MSVRKIATTIERFPWLFRVGVKAYGIRGFKIGKTHYKLYDKCEQVKNSPEKMGKEFKSIYMFDLQCLQTKTRQRGIGTYTLEFLQATVLKNPETLILGFFTNCSDPKEVFEGCTKVQSIESDNFEFIQLIIDSPQKKLNATEAIHILKREIEFFDPDVVFDMSPFENIQSAIPIPTSNRYQKVSMFYDAIPMKYPEDLLPSKKQKELYRWQLNQLLESDFVFSISDYSTEVILKLGLKRKRVMTIGGGPRSLKFSQPISEVSKRHGILCVTAEQKHKNLLAGIQAYANLPKLVRLKHPFFVAGIRSNGFKKYILKKAKKYGVNVIILPYLSELEMSSLLSKCRVLLIPSFAEGLSLPLLDALNHDLLVLGSRGTVVDEILNSPISTFNPESLHQIVKVLSLFLLDDALWKSTLNQQKERVTTFTWSATAIIASKKLTELILAVKSNE